MNRKFSVTSLLNPSFAPVLILLLLALVLGLSDPRILSPGNLLTITIAAVPIVLVALATMVTLVSGGIDLSVGNLVTFLCITLATVLTATGSLPLALAAGLLTALAVGAVNGTLVGLLRIPPFIATLATMIALQGATLYFAQAGVLIIKEPLLRAMGQGALFGVPMLIFYALAAGLVAYFIMRHTPFGLRIYAIGSDADAVELSGVPVARMRFLTYMLASVFAFLCVIALIGRVPIVTATMGGTSLLLDGFSAAVLGGVSIFGGRGTVLGVFCGALAISLITAATQVFGVDPAAIGLIKGMIVLLALGTDRGLQWLSSRYSLPKAAAS